MIIEQKNNAYTFNRVKIHIMDEKPTIQTSIANILKGIATIAVSLVSFVLILWALVGCIRVITALFS